MSARTAPGLPIDLISPASDAVAAAERNDIAAAERNDIAAAGNGMATADAGLCDALVQAAACQLVHAPADVTGGFFKGLLQASTIAGEEAECYWQAGGDSRQRAAWPARIWQCEMGPPPTATAA